MGTSPTPQVTDFTRDVQGRYLCNGLDEALASTDRYARPDAKPFDVIVIGAGAVGGAVAQHLFAQDRTRSHRILVLEAGPYLLPEHLQNLPLRGLQIYGPSETSIKDLRDSGQYGLDNPRDEVWGLPWHSNEKFPGLAFVVGGRSLAWGGWSPKWIRAELPTDGQAPWPQRFVDDMFAKHLDETAEQLGVTETNDFIYGPLHDALRARLAAGIRRGAVRGALPLGDVPAQVARPAGATRGEHKLEAPLAVQTRARAGYFPVNKYSSVPVLMKAARDAFGESGMDDVKKRLMVVPQCHVKRLHTNGWGPNQTVTAVETNQGTVPVPPGGKVVLAMGTIENARLALVSFDGIANYHLVGKGLGAHLISFFMFRIPREAFDLDPDLLQELQASALYVKGRRERADGTHGYFHLQLSGTGLGPWDFNAEAEIWQKIPDLDQLEQFRYANDTHVVMACIGIGEMQPLTAGNEVRLDPELDEFGVPRAFVSLRATHEDMALWDAMDAAADDVARVLAGKSGFEIITWDGIIPVAPGQSPADLLPYQFRRAGLGTSHHEVSSLWMGDDPNRSVTDADARFHHVSNAYVAGPAAYATGGGSAGPVLTGTAMGRRLAEHLIPDPQPYVAERGYRALFDGMSTAGWMMAGSGGFTVVDGSIETIPGDDLGLVWFTQQTPEAFELKLEWRRYRREDNSGVFVRFPNPDSKGYHNTAYVAVHFGFEVQIDDVAPGSIYGTTAAAVAVPQRPLGQWNEFTIRVVHQSYAVALNGYDVAAYENRDPGRGAPASAFMGLQCYPGSRVGFRKIRIKPLR